MKKQSDTLSKTIITNRSRMLRSPRHSRFHWLFALLFLLTSGGALWQHSDPRFTFLLMILVFPCAAMVYVPYRCFNSWARIILNALIFAMAVTWGVFRLKNTLPDLVMVEILSGAALVFLMGGKIKDYCYLFFISLFLLIYGSLIPRMTFLYMETASLLLFLFLAWNLRKENFAGKPVIRERKSLKIDLVRIMIHLFLTLFLFWNIFSLMPLENNDLPGLFETSFLTNRDSALPPDIQKWLNPVRLKTSPDGKFEKPAEKTVHTIDSKGTPVKSDKPADTKNFIDGDGGGSSQGQDLVFHVQTPVTTYHLARLYDIYDGTKWKAGKELMRARYYKVTSEKEPVEQMIAQKYYLLKNISTSLYSGFRLIGFTPSNENYTNILRNFTMTFYGIRQKKKIQQMPFIYTADVSLPLLDDPEKLLKKEDQGSGGKKKNLYRKWRDPLSPAHYCKLPKGKISKRVLSLAKRITEKAGTPYAKAIALRDHLRNNYKYKLDAAPLPKGRECVDYFLFELKEGHCEYYAAALAVMARSVGLPARVATGFSPGNYNTLNNKYEVYEYHAHAWTQIFIDNAGWLTMDGTPPSSVRSETKPAGIGQLRDPFGDEWKVTPPELTRKTQDLLRKKILEQEEKRKEINPIDQALIHAVVTEEKVRENVKNQYRKTVKKIDRQKKEGGFLYKLKMLYRKIVDQFKNIVAGIYDLVFSTWLLLILTGSLLYSLYKFGTILFCARKQKRKLSLAEKFYRKAEEKEKSSPRDSVLFSYRAIILYLELLGLERKGNPELTEYAEMLSFENSLLGEKTRAVFLLFYKAEYSSREITEQESGMALEVLKYTTDLFHERYIRKKSEL